MQTKTWIAGPVSRFLPAFAKASAGKPASKSSAAVPLEAKRSGVGNPSTTATRLSKGFSTLWILIAVAVVGVVAVLAFGVLDIAKIKKPDVGRLPAADQQIQQLETLSASDEIADIEKDLNATDLDAIDDELSEVDRDLGDL